MGPSVHKIPNRTRVLVEIRCYQMLRPDTELPLHALRMSVEDTQVDTIPKQAMHRMSVDGFIHHVNLRNYHLPYVPAERSEHGAPSLIIPAGRWTLTCWHRAMRG